ncbi:MAG: NAD(P)-dependent dehydrogenase (short-subunit alcohol dehydrogenase family) [Bermanella sp.]|jgi:NAD(P)-dependent dehydrogenase (short-subunit alcohol dehydrogenase family)
MNTSKQDPFDLSGRVALVTGASSGLGEHFAKVLVGAGASVVLAARRKDRLEKLVAEIAQTGGKALAVAMDVNDRASVQAGFDAAQATFGVVTVLVNNAGVARPGRFLDGDDAGWDFTMNTNLKAVWRVSQEAAGRMVASRSAGSIVNIASILGLQPGLNQAFYATAKAGVVQLSKTTALELWRKNIRVNALCPGYFETEMNSGFFQSEKGAAYLEKIPPQRLGELDELSGPLLLLASDAGSFMTGVALPVDGGHLLQGL